SRSCGDNDPNDVGITPELYPLAMYLSGSVIDSLTNWSSGTPAACASDVSCLSRSGPIEPVAPAAASVWQPEQPFDENSVLPWAIRAASRPPLPVPPPVAGVVTAGPVVAIGCDSDRPMLEDWSLDEVLMAITTTITAMPTTVPMSAAARTLITAVATIPI